MDQNFLTVDELADKLRVHRSWVYSKSREAGPNAIPKVKVGKYLRFRLEDVIEWLESRQDRGRE